MKEEYKPVERRLYTSKETMEYLNISKNKLHELVKDGILLNVGLDTNYRFDKRDLDEIIEKVKGKTIEDLKLNMKNAEKA